MAIYLAVYEFNSLICLAWNNHFFFTKKINDVYPNMYNRPIKDVLLTCMHWDFSAPFEG